MSLTDDLAARIGAEQVLTGPAMAAYLPDWTGHHTTAPLAVARPGSTEEVAACIRLAAAAGVPVVPAGGRTGITGGLETRGGLLLSLERMNRIRAVKPEARLAVVEAGCVLSSLHDAAEAAGLYFPLWFGARGSAMIGGVLSTNAGGSNVLRYGSTRGLCLGLEVVLADGRVLDLMGELHKDNSGYDLKQLFIGAEGTLGVITAAVMRLVPKPAAHATATLALHRLEDALGLLRRLQAATGGAVEAFEYMSPSFMRQLARYRPDIRQPFDPIAPCTILVEIAAPTAEAAVPDGEGSRPLDHILQAALAAMLEDGTLVDAEIAASEAQRLAMWRRRELAAEVMFSRQAHIDTDIALPLDRVAVFLNRIAPRIDALDPGAEPQAIAHLGDGNIHFTVYPTRADPALEDAVIEQVEGLVAELGGSFSAEHGVGLSKLASMARRKNPVALEVMRAVKAALDPGDLMNPGKVIPPRP